MIRRMFRHRHKKDVFVYNVWMGGFRIWDCRCGEQWYEHYW